MEKSLPLAQGERKLKEESLGSHGTIRRWAKDGNLLARWTCAAWMCFNESSHLGHKVRLTHIAGHRRRRQRRRESQTTTTTVYETRHVRFTEFQRFLERGTFWTMEISRPARHESTSRFSFSSFLPYDWNSNRCICGSGARTAWKRCTEGGKRRFRIIWFLRRIRKSLCAMWHSNLYYCKIILQYENYDYNMKVILLHNMLYYCEMCYNMVRMV